MRFFAPRKKICNTMKNSLFVIAALLVLGFLGCKNESNSNAASDSSADQPVKVDGKIPLFDSTAYAQEMAKKQKEAEANVITPDNFTQKSPAGAMAIGKVENTLFEKNDALASAIKAYLTGKNIVITYDNGQYGYNLLDLNGDGAQDALVYLPGSNFCEGNKCTVLVAKGDAAGKFKVHSMIQHLGLPVLVCDASETKGWRDIVTQVFDSENRAASVKIAFDGSKYTEAVSKAKALDKAVMVSGFLMNGDKTSMNLAAN